MGLSTNSSNGSISGASGRSLANSQALQSLLGLGPELVRNSEYVGELYYTIAPVPGLLIRPNLQYIYTPGTISQNTNIVVLGLKTVISF